MKNNINSLELRTEEMMINMGPHHPATHGVLRLKLTLDGEYVKNVEPVIGYLHRGMECLAEQRNYFTYQADLDRVDYLSGMSCNEAFSMAVENLANISIPERAKYIRVICSELNRIASHLLWLGSALLDLGAMMGFPFFTFREREVILNFLEEISGQRMMYNFLRIGGVKTDLSQSWLDKVKEFCMNVLPTRIAEYEAIANNNPIFVSRMKGIGYLPKDIALSYNVTGQNLRASGKAFDLRKTANYSVYDCFDFEIPVSNDSDCYARYICRVKEMYESAKIIVQAIEQIPNGEYKSSKKISPSFKLPQGESFAAVESPRGYLGVYIVSDGSSSPYRVRWHSPSFNNLSVLPYLLMTPDKHGNPVKMSDIMSCIASLDFIMPDVDR